MTARLKFRSSLPADVQHERADHIAAELGLPNVVARVLVARGITDVQEARDFMNPSLDTDWHNPYDIDNLKEAVDVIESAIRQNKRIVVYGDYDADGFTATTVMTRAIRELGGVALPFIPSRLDEGYSLSKTALDRASELNGDLLVTVDCGISSKDEVVYAQQLGMDVVVTDHHEAGTSIPEGIPVVDPKAQSDNPSSILAGVGVALKVVQALGARFGQPHLWRDYTDIATIGTLADLMPLEGENRALVADGIKKIRENPRPSFSALTSVSGTRLEEISSTSIPFSINPRINAAGRMGNIDVALDLLMCDDKDDAMRLAQELDAINKNRFEAQDELSGMALEAARRDYKDERVVVVSGERWHKGIIGLVANKLVDAFGVPALVFSSENGVAKGSGRSVGNVNLFEALEATADHVLQFGGHSGAIGVTIETSNIERFKQALNEYMQNLPEEEFIAKCDIDTVVDIDELTLENLEALKQLAPFGSGNPEPVFLAKNISLVNCMAKGKNQRTLGCTLSNGVSHIDAIKFNCKEIDDLLNCNETVDAVFTADINCWNGRRTPQANIKEIFASRNCSALHHCLDLGARSYIDGLYNDEFEANADCDSVDKKVSCEKDKWEELAKSDPERLKEEILKALIGDRQLHDSQKQALDLLFQGESVLTVMGTGRGKSLIFQAYAAYLALTQHKCSLFVYPLRALMTDQAFHIQQKFDKFGIVCKVLNGQTSQSERLQTYEDISTGKVDIVLTTPEYLSFHANQIASGDKIGFVVIDEAHHIGQAKAGQRPAYKILGESLKVLHSPQIIALTATADTAIADRIQSDLGISARVVDNSARSNLQIDDRRNLPSKDDYLAHIVASGEKCIIYVNSRTQSVSLARLLRSKIANLAPMIGFYNAGMSRDDRTKIEDYFRRGEIRTLVATSAFGEGIDIPDIRHVVLYHMPFSDIEFNQMSGRAGRDGQTSYIHLLYGKGDASINKSLMSSLAPGREALSVIYRRLRSMQEEGQQSCVAFDFDTFAKEANKSRIKIDPLMVEFGIRVFRELKLIETIKDPSESDRKCQIRVIVTAAKTELTESESYNEGLSEMQDFVDFKEWALKCDSHTLRTRIIHPISPDLDE